MKRFVSFYIGLPGSTVLDGVAVLEELEGGEALDLELVPEGLLHGRVDLGELDVRAGLLQLARGLLVF